MLRPGHRYTLRELLPHGPRMLLLDRLAGYTHDTLTCEVDVREGSKFCDGKSVPGWVGLEWMAQTLGAFTGAVRLQQGKKVQLEMLIGSRAYECSVPAFAVGKTLTITARLLFWDPDGMCAFACEIVEGSSVLATAEVKGYEPDDIEPFLQQLEGQA
jgi:predicted hotdog family 3-hydroxylacyl-ACP dehydratase